MRAENWANQEKKTYVRVRAGTECMGGVIPVTYCVPAIEAKLWELLHGEIIFPEFGEDYRPPDFDPDDWDWEDMSEA